MRTCDDCIHKAVCYRYSYGLPENYADKCGDYEPSRHKGHWIKREDDTCWWYVCSECEQESLKNRWNDDDVLSRFCPNCGAEMESEE